MGFKRSIFRNFQGFGSRTNSFRKSVTNGHVGLLLLSSIMFYPCLLTNCFLNIRESANFSNFQKVNWKGSLSHSQRKDHQTSSDTLEPTICMDLPISHSSQTTVTTSAYISLILLLHSTSCLLYFIMFIHLSWHLARLAGGKKRNISDSNYMILPEKGSNIYIIPPDSLHTNLRMIHSSRSTPYRSMIYGWFSQNPWQPPWPLTSPPEAAVKAAACRQNLRTSAFFVDMAMENHPFLDDVSQMWSWNVPLKPFKTSIKTSIFLCTSIWLGDFPACHGNGKLLVAPI